MMQQLCIFDHCCFIVTLAATCDFTDGSVLQYRLNVLVPKQTKRQTLDAWLDWHRAAVLRRQAIAKTVEVGKEWHLLEVWEIWRFQARLGGRAKAWLARSRRSTFEG